MKALLACTAFAACILAFPAVAVDAPAKGSASAGNRMDPAKGAFHKVHTKKMKLGCDTCHESEAKDLLVVAKPSSKSPGHVNREACLGCHQQPGKPTWYGRAP